MQLSKGTPPSSGDVWVPVLDELVLPSDTNRSRALLERCVQEGHFLVLYAYLRKRLPKCLDIGEESVILKSVMDWFRHLKMRWGLNGIER